ncbi:transposase family protein [Actinomyces oris]|uniref:transposase family protein n=1 Tax=Actinomyces oris TaxID=544580 RepID=UPI003D2EAF36
MADPRDRRGVRHSLLTVLSLAITGVLAGCRSLTAIWEHTTDLTGADLEVLGLQTGQALPSESTIRRVLQGLEPADLDALLRSWLCTRAVKALEAPAWVDFPGAARAVQVRRTRTVKSRKHVEVAYPGLLPAHDRRPARGRRGLGPRALGDREPSPLDPGRGLR